MSAGVVKAALKFAGLKPEALRSGHHPDTGDECLCLEADIRQYSAFLAFLAAQICTIDRLGLITDRVRLHISSNGDTLFWLPDIEMSGR